MYNFSIRGKSVELDLKPGIYVFDCVTASGKTFLCSMLKTFKTLGQPVGGYSYNDVLEGRSLQSYINGSPIKYLVIDRYDMYLGKCDEDINKLVESGCVIVIDCKFKNDLNLDYDIAILELTAGKVRVYS